MASLIYAGGSKTLLMFSITGLQHANSLYNFRFRINGGSWQNTGSTNLGSFNGLSCGTSYSCEGQAEYPKDSGTWYSFTNSFSTDACAPVYPSPPSWTTTSTTTTITTYVTFGANTHHVKVDLPGASTPTLTLYSNGNVTHTGLTANTNYTLYIQAWDSTETYGSGSQYYVVKTAGARPSNFSGWGITVAAGQPCAITAAKWNEFTAKINAFRVYKVLSNYGFTTAVPGNDIYAWMANQLVNGMAGLGVSPPATVSSGQDFTAAWLNALTTALNSVV